jgi:hypothetical protein
MKWYNWNIVISDVYLSDIVWVFFVAFDCYDIGEVIFEHEYNRIAKQWFQTALVKVKDIDVTKTNVTEFMFNLNKYLDKLKRHVSSSYFVDHCLSFFCWYILVWLMVFDYIFGFL